MADLRREN
ncbi:hypothetical protein CP10139811_1575A, partial [Chlamydia ibidis]